MMNRASNYMTLAFIKMPSIVLCLSYKGKKGQRNLEDVHDLVFRMPTIEYRNKTWSNLDLALQLKKDVIRVLISHTGAIIGNKLSHHKPSRQAQSRLREIANMSTLIKDSASTMASSGASSAQDLAGRPSTASERPSTLSRSISYDSMHSVATSDGGANEQRATDTTQRPATSDSPGSNFLQHRLTNTSLEADVSAAH
jgi:hypothetical protein